MTTYTYPEPAASPLPVGAASSANQVLQLAQETAISGKLPATLGQKTKAASLPVVLSSDSDVLPVSLAAGFSTSALQVTGNASLTSIDGKLTTISSTLTSISENTKLGVIDQIDSTPLLDCSTTNIPASAGNPVTVVASLAAAAKKIISVEDIGEYIGVYTGVALSEVLYCILPLGGGEIEVNIPIATRISLRAMKNTAITSSSIALNFLG